MIYPSESTRTEGRRTARETNSAIGSRRLGRIAILVATLLTWPPVAAKADGPHAPAAVILAQAEQPADAANQAKQPADTKAQAQQPAKAQQPQVDESALRYFAAKGDEARLAAEIARLKALYPNWVPPADPLAVPENTDTKLEAMWRLYSESKFTELRQAIADRQKAEPGWQPPSDLLDRLQVGEKRAALVAASDNRKYADVVTLGAETPSLLTCGDVDILWRVAEAFFKTDRAQRAVDAYTYILGNCTDTNERRATIQKAAALLDYQQMEPLLSLEKTLPDGTLEFESIRDDLARRFVAEGNKVGGPTIAPVYLERLQRKVEADGSPSDGALLGWYYIRHNDMASAEPYFRKAREKQDSAPVSQGLALTLIARQEPREAEDVMYRWRETSDDARATYFAATANLLSLDPLPVLPVEVLRRMAAATTQHKQIETAEQFGWYALTFRQPRTAAQWFRTTLGWKPDYEPGAYGLALARLRLNDLDGVRQIQKIWAGRSQRIAQLFDTRKKKRIDDIPSPDGVTPASNDESSVADDSNATETETKKDTSRNTPSVEERYAAEDEDNAEEEPVAKPQRQVPSKRRRLIVRRTYVASPQAGCQFTTTIPAGASPEAALSRGWCLMQINRPMQAADAFEAALGSSVPKTREDAAYGQSLAYLRLGLIDNAAISATKAKLNLSRTVELQKAILSARAINAYNAGHSRETVLYLDQLAQLETERADLLILRAYAYRKLDRSGEARKIFEALAATGNRDAIHALGDIRQEGPRRIGDSP